METSATIDLPLPERRPPGYDGFDCQSRAVESWLQQLPVADLGEAGRRVYEALHSSNRLEVRPALRLDFLEQLRDIVRYLVDGLRKHYRGRELPLKAKPRQVVELATLLLQEMALGYEVVVGTGRGSGLVFSRRSLALAIDRALRYRAWVLLENWMVYGPEPPETWSRLHALYGIAEATGTTDQHVPDPHLDGPRRSTPATAYKHVLLLAASGPGRLQRGEVLDVYRLLQHWARHAELLDTDADRAGAALFRVPRSGDAAPHPSLPDQDRPDDRLLVTTPLIRVMEREQARTTGGTAFWRRKPLGEVHPELSRRIMLALGAVSARRHRRLRTETRVRTAVGLAHIHRTLCEELGREDEIIDRAEARFEGRDARNPIQDGNEVWDLVYSSELMRLVEKQGRRSDTTPDRSKIDPQRWNLVNVSAGGYCLLCDPGHTVRMQVGELIGIRETERPGLPWQLCAVRWLRVPDEGGMEMGVELLGPGPAPVAVRADRRDGAPGPPEPGLLLPAVAATEQPPTLITAGSPPAPDHNVHIVHGPNEETVVLERHLDTTARFAQSRFRRTEPPGRDDGLEALVSPSL